MLIGTFYPSIDLGNGNTKPVYCNELGQTIAVRSERGKECWPTVVFETSDGQYLFGEDAAEQALVYPAQAASGFKMHLDDNTKRYFGGKMSAKEVVGVAIKSVVAQIEKQAGIKPDGVFITCPATFNDALKQGLLDGFALAGVKVIRLLTEPAAAAFAYADEIRGGQGETVNILCLDLGHRTFDVSVLGVKDGVAIPIATEGIATLGGRDFNIKLLDLLLQKISKSIGKQITHDKLTAQQMWELEEKIEKAKQALSGQATSTKVAVNFGGKPQLVEITQAEADASFAPFVQAIKDCTDKTLKGINKTFKDMHAVVLAGAPFHSRKLQEEVANHTGIVPKINRDPAIVVASGAAKAAFQYAREQNGLGCLPDKPRLREATGHDIGVCVLEASSGSVQALNAVVVAKNTPVPATVSELYRLERENQTEVLIDVLQGPNGASESICLKIGSIRMTGLPTDPTRSQRIKVDFNIDDNGICSVTATDKISGKKQTISIKLNDGQKAA